MCCNMKRPNLSLKGIDVTNRHQCLGPPPPLRQSLQEDFINCWCFRHFLVVWVDEYINPFFSICFFLEGTWRDMIWRRRLFMLPNDLSVDLTHCLAPLAPEQPKPFPTNLRPQTSHCWLYKSPKIQGPCMFCWWIEQPSRIYRIWNLRNLPPGRINVMMNISQEKSAVERVES